MANGKEAMKLKAATKAMNVMEKKTCEHFTVGTFLLHTCKFLSCGFTQQAAQQQGERLNSVM